MNHDMNLWNSPLTRSVVRTDDVRLPEMLMGYFIGPFGALLSSGIYTSILQNYFTDVLQLDLSFLTSLQLVSTILIVAANLIVGQLIERTHALAGKARPWILLSALLLSVSSILMFLVPFEGTARMIWIAIAYNLYYAVAYPIYNTANSTLIPVSTRDGRQRAVLASFTNMAGLGVMGVGSMVFPVLVSFALKDNQARWFAAMLAVAVFTALTTYLQFRFTRERVTEELAGTACEESVVCSEEENYNAGIADSGSCAHCEHHDLAEGRAAGATGTATLAAQLRAVTGEKWWWIIIAFYLVFQWAGAMKNGSMSFYCKWVLDNTFYGSADAWGASQSLLAILGAIPMAAAAIFVVPLSNRYGKQRVTFIGLVAGVAGGIIAGLGSGSMIPVAIGVALKCLGSAPACYLILAMLADVIDHIEYKTGIRTDGLTMSIYSSIMVAATPVCNSIFSAILNISGYDQTANVILGRAGQTLAAQNAIAISYIWVETIAYAVGALLILSFTVERHLPEEQAAIAARREAG